MRIWLTMLMLVLPLAAAEHHGQVKFGGLPLPGATVTVTSASGKQSTVTDAQGVYAFPELADGEWTIRIEMLCFAPLEGKLAAGTPGDWELNLLPPDQIGLVKAPVVAQVPVAAAAPVSRKRGKVPPPSAANTAGGFQRADVKASGPAPAAGTPPSETPTESAAELNQKAADGFLINGSTNNGAMSPFSLAGGFGNTRKGPGSLYNGNIGLIFDNSKTDARSYSLTGQDTLKPAYNLLTGVFSFGGPLKIPRLIQNGPNFTLNYQWTRDRNATSQPGRMPTGAERSGDFSQLPVHVIDPSTNAPFPGNRVPLNRISPQATALLALYPLPNFDGSARYNYQLALAAITHQDNLQTRANKTVGKRDQLNGAFAYQNTRADSTNLLGFLDTTDSAGINTNINWRHNFNPRLSMTSGYQFSRLSTRVIPYFENRIDVSGRAGITGTNPDPINWGPPNLSFASGITRLTDANPAFTRNQTSAVSLAAIWNRGRHNVGFGGDLRRQQFNLLSQQDPRGSFSFNGAAAGSDFAGFLLGVPDTSAIAFGNADKYLRAWANDFYFTDDWRINPGLTVNAGMRWEYGSPITELYGRLVNLDLTPAFRSQAPVVANQPSGPLTKQTYPDSLVRPDKHGFQPRIGVSWRPFPASSLVIRAGYGIYYNTSVYQAIATQMAQQSPLSKSLSVQNTAANPLTLANGFNAAPGITPNTFAVDPDFQVGYAHNWQVSIQRDLPGALVMMATYLGIKGTRGVQIFLPNTYPTGVSNPCFSCPTGFAYMTSNGNSTRESGQIQLRRRLHSGFTSSVQYTFAKAIDDAALGGRGQGSSVIAQDWLNLRGERGLSNFDQRHAVTVQGQYTTGMGIGGGALSNGRLASLLKEWTLSSQVTAGTGLPLTPIFPSAVNGTGVTGSIRPDYTGAAVGEAPPGLFLNPAAYVAPATGRWGNAGRNSITGPSQFTMSASLGRVFRLADRLNAEFRVDAANPINHPTYLNWNTTVSSTQFGLPTAVNPMRSLQTTLRVRF